MYVYHRRSFKAVGVLEYHVLLFDNLGTRMIRTLMMSILALKIHPDTLLPRYIRLCKIKFIFYDHC